MECVLKMYSGPPAQLAQVQFSIITCELQQGDMTSYRIFQNSDIIHWQCMQILYIQIHKHFYSIVKPMTAKQSHQNTHSEDKQKEEPEIMLQAEPFQILRKMQIGLQPLKDYFNDFLKQQKYDGSKGSILYHFKSLNQQSQNIAIARIPAFIQFLQMVARLCNTQKEKQQTLDLVGAYIQFKSQLQIEKKIKQAISQSSKESTHSVKPRSKFQECTGYICNQYISQLVSSLIQISMLIPQYKIFMEGWTNDKYAIIIMGIILFVYNLGLVIYAIYKMCKKSPNQQKKSIQKTNEQSQLEQSESASNLGLKQRGGGGGDIAVDSSGPS